jgi:hypothetical protein
VLGLSASAGLSLRRWRFLRPSPKLIVRLGFLASCCCSSSCTMGQAGGAQAAAALAAGWRSRAAVGRWPLLQGASGAGAPTTTSPVALRMRRGARTSSASARCGGSCDAPGVSGSGGRGGGWPWGGPGGGGGSGSACLARWYMTCACRQRRGHEPLQRRRIAALAPAARRIGVVMQTARRPTAWL